MKPEAGLSTKKEGTRVAVGELPGYQVRDGGGRR